LETLACLGVAGAAVAAFAGAGFSGAEDWAWAATGVPSAMKASRAALPSSAPMAEPADERSGDARRDGKDRKDGKNGTGRDMRDTPLGVLAASADDRPKRAGIEHRRASFMLISGP